jgi:hypothetical protein
MSAVSRPKRACAPNPVRSNSFATFKWYDTERRDVGAARWKLITAASTALRARPSSAEVLRRTDKEVNYVRERNRER